MIKPTPGCTVLFVLTSTMPHFAGNAGQRFPALLCQVNDDRNINVCVFDGVGRQHPMENLHLRQPEDPSEPGGNHCEWMPYQKAVATGEFPATQHALTPVPQPQPAPIAPLGITLVDAAKAAPPAETPPAVRKGPFVGQEVYLYRPGTHTIRATIIHVHSKSSVNVSFDGEKEAEELTSVAVLPANCGVPNLHVELIEPTEASAPEPRGVPGGTPVAPPTAAPSAKALPARKAAKKAKRK